MTEEAVWAAKELVGMAAAVAAGPRFPRHSSSAPAMGGTPEAVGAEPRFQRRSRSAVTPLG